MRKRRLLQQGASYHVVSRVNRREMIFNTDEVKEMFLEVIRRAQKKYKFIITNFCIMGNHYHIIVKPLQKESLSQIMRWILGVFAMRYNKIYHLTGHVWHDRFKSKIIHSYRQYISTFIYIARNPIHAKITEHATDYFYSGISFIHKGLLDILERPPNLFLRHVWQRINRSFLPQN